MQWSTGGIQVSLGRHSVERHALNTSICPTHYQEGLGHSKHLRASHHANEARRAEPSCEFAARQERKKNKHRGLSDRNGPTKFWGGDLQVVDKVGVPDGI